MTAAARTKAERCFALARSTTFEAERDSAVARGIAIAEKAGLSLDLFDIPGRSRGRVNVHRVEGQGYLTPEMVEAMVEALYAMGTVPTFVRRARYCPHGSDMALFGESCVLCERERRSSTGGARLCPGGCGTTILFGDSCVECDRSGFA